MALYQSSTNANQVKDAEQNAKTALAIIADVITQRFGNECLPTLQARQEKFREHFDQQYSDDKKLSLIATWAENGVQQESWATLEQEELFEMAARLSVLRAFLGEAVLMMDKQAKAKIKKEMGKKKKAKSKMARASRKANRQK